MSDSNPVSGRCLCGAVQFAYSGEPNWTVYCHCESCRRATSSPVTTWISVPAETLRFVQGMPRYFQSSPEARRGFCAQCGSPMTYEHERFPGEVHLYAAALTDSRHVVPSGHVFVDEQLDWFEVHDDLPRFATTGREQPPIRRGPKQD